MSEDDIAMLAATIRRAEGHIHRGQSLIDEAARLLMSHLPATIDDDDPWRD
jgi:hypothetical protein